MKQFILPKNHFFHVKTIGDKLFLAVMGGAFVGLGSTAFLYYQVLENQSKIQIRNTLSTEVNGIESQLTPIKQSVINLGGMVQHLKKTGVQDPDAYQAIMLDFFLKRPPLVMGLSMQQAPYGIFADRKWYATYYYADQKVLGQIGKRLPSPNTSVLFSDLVKEDNAPNQAYFKDTIASRQDIWLEPYDWYSISMTTANHLLLDRRDRLQGFVGMDVDTTQLNATIHPSVINNTGYFVVMTQRGTLVSYPPDMGKVRQSYRSIPTLAAIWPLLQRDTAGLFQSNGQYWVYQRIPSTQWIMLAVVPESVVFWPILTTTLGGAGIAAIVLAVVVICFVKLLNRRLKPILDECYRLEAEDIQRSIRLGQVLDQQNVAQQIWKFKLKQVDELEILQQVFWRVAAQVKASLDELEFRVAERTAQLNEAMQLAENAKEIAISANQSKSQFLANMSHELRTPLNAVLGFSQILHRDPLISKDQRKKLSIINRSGEHLLTLINDILTMSKIEAGRTTLNETRFDFRALILSVYDMLSIKASEKGLTFKIECSQDIAQVVQSDEGKLRQVLINLIGNAIKFTHQGSVSLRVNTTFHRGNVSAPKICPMGYTAASLHFEVEDTGVGIAPHELEHSFEAFVQTESGRQSQEGTGLGLPISRTFVQLMGGEISVRSTLGKGSCFAFDIQVYLLENAPASSEVLGNVIGLVADQMSYRVLVVEDRWENQQVVMQLLETVGFETQVASNGEEAIALWQATFPDLILMDLQMPVMDGYEAMRQIKQQAAQKQLQPPIVIAITANTLEEVRYQTLEIGFDDFVNKPFQAERLFEIIAKHLGVRYVRETTVQAKGLQLQTLPHSESMSLTAEDLQRLPSAWLSQVYRSALELDEPNLEMLIDDICQDHPVIATTLKQWLEKLEFEKIIDLVEPNLNLT